MDNILHVNDLITHACITTGPRRVEFANALIQDMKDGIVISKSPALFPGRAVMFEMSDIVINDMLKERIRLIREAKEINQNTPDIIFFVIHEPDNIKDFKQDSIRRLFMNAKHYYVKIVIIMDINNFIEFDPVIRTQIDQIYIDTSIQLVDIRLNKNQAVIKNFTIALAGYMNQRFIKQIIDTIIKGPQNNILIGYNCFNNSISNILM